jgi:FixJ family two-component response regulator
MTEVSKDARDTSGAALQDRAKGATGGDPARPRVLVVDDESSMRAALRRLFSGAGFRVELYESGTALLEAAELQQPGCILLDVQMPDMDGLSVQRALLERQVELPMLFLTGSSAIRHAVEAMRSGAVDFVEKPFDNDDLLRRVERAYGEYQRQHAAHQTERALIERFKKLTPRQTEVLALIAKGLTNKEAARLLGTSYRTVEIQRSQIMERMQADSLADLVRMYMAATAES